jgi:hypothetical protein
MPSPPKKADSATLRTAPTFQLIMDPPATWLGESTTQTNSDIGTVDSENGSGHFMIGVLWARPVRRRRCISNIRPSAVFVSWISRQDCAYFVSVYQKALARISAPKMLFGNERCSPTVRYCAFRKTERREGSWYIASDSGETTF